MTYEYHVNANFADSMKPRFPVHSWGICALSTWKWFHVQVGAGCHTINFNFVILTLRFVQADSEIGYDDFVTLSWSVNRVSWD